MPLNKFFSGLISRLSPVSGYAVLVRNADAARDRKNWQDAAELYEKALALRPNESGIWVQLGNMSKEAKQYGRSRAAYETALKIDNRSSDTFLQLGHLLKLSGDATGAQEAYQRALALDPANRDADIEIRAATSAKAVIPPSTRRRSRSKTRARPLHARVIRARTELQDLLLHAKSAQPQARSSTVIERAKPALAAAVAELDQILVLIRNADLQAEQPSGVSSTDEVIEVVFDVSDLIQYFRHHRLPTGIQRVQIEVISIAILQLSTYRRVRVCCFTESTDYWREVPPDDFLVLCDLSLVDNDWNAPDWRDAMDALEDEMNGSVDFQFSRGSMLVNIGTSWWLQNYFLYIREAKRTQRIYYIPFVHDMIPIITPEFCVEGLVQDFISWAQGVYQHADFFLVNSEATRRDVKRVGTALGHTMDDNRIHTVTLDADYRKPDGTVADNTALAEHRLQPHRFVLFVSTIEARKNHIAVFDAWLRLIKECGSDVIPRLVCVGSRGWLNDAVFAKLDASRLLREKVLILSGVPDAELAALYQNCLFSVYPSHYEGWGLPVTEALSYGKTAVVSRSSSLTEAGGEFVDYFDLGNEAQLLEALRRMILDQAYRAAREATVRARFKARTWEIVAQDLLGAVQRWRDDGQPTSGSAQQAELGRYYAFARNAEVGVYAGMQTGEIFRVGRNWWGPNPWGCWLKPGPGQIHIVVDAPGTYVLQIGLQALPETDVPFDTTVLGGMTKRGLIEAGKSKWLAIDCQTTKEAETLVVVVEGYALDHIKPRDDQDPVPVSIGLIGFMLCSADDARSRGRMVEAIARDELGELARTKTRAVYFPAQIAPGADTREADATVLRDYVLE